MTENNSEHGNKSIINTKVVTDDDYKLVYSFFEFTQDLLCIASFEGYLLKVNPAVINLLGYTEEELKANYIGHFVHPDDKQRTKDSRKGVINGKPLFNFENRYVKKSGETVWLSWTSVPIESEKIVFAIAKDITVRKKLEEEKNALYENIAATNKNLEHFSRVASHDLRAPINNILGLFDLLDLSTIENSETVGVIELIKMSTQKVNKTLETYINDLVKRHNRIKDKEDIVLSEIINSVLLSIDVIIKSTDTKIELDLADFNIVSFNKGYLESIILNLLTNAIRYVATNRTPHIKIAAKYLGNKKQLIVSDNGIGFDMDKVRGKIFGLNQTFHHHKDSKGIGLYLVKTYIDEMGATIEVESKINQGTTFVITFAN